MKRILIVCKNLFNVLDVAFHEEGKGKIVKNVAVLAQSLFMMHFERERERKSIVSVRRMYYTTSNIQLRSCVY